jgi:hypothetical protein
LEELFKQHFLNSNCEVHLQSGLFQSFRLPEQVWIQENLYLVQDEFSDNCNSENILYDLMNPRQEMSKVLSIMSFDMLIFEGCK